MAYDVASFSGNTPDPQLTVGLPVYNMAPYIESAVTSLLSQTFGKFTLVVSDNASDDGTAEILRRIAAEDRRVKLIEQPGNVGVFANFRAVFDACETPYFMWASGDDVWENTWIERLLPLTVGQGGIAFGAVQMVDDALNEIPHPANHRDLSFAGPRLIRRLMYFLDPGLLGRANPIFGIFHKDMLSESAWNEFAKGQFGADVMLLYVMLRHVEIHCDTNVVLFKRKHAKSAAVSDSGMARKRIFRRTQLPQFWRLSSWDERLGLVLLYPLAALRVFLAKLTYLKGKVRSHNRTGCVKQ